MFILILNGIESLISQALNDMEISPKEFITILNEKDKYEKMKKDIEDKNEHKKTRNYKILRYKIKNIFFPYYKNVRDNKKELL